MANSSYFKRYLNALAVLATVALVPLVAGAAAGPDPLAMESLPSAFQVVDDVPLPDPDLWERIRLGFALDPLDSPLVAQQEEWYASRPDYIKRFVDRGSLYLHYIVEQVEKRHMPTEIALLPVIESAFAPNAKSRARASGLWQFIPSTARNFGLKQNWWVDKRNDIVAATNAALDYLQKLHDEFGSWELALAAYNCGEGCVSRAIAWNQEHGLPTDYVSLSLRLPPETRTYVPKLMAVKNIVLSPATYGVELDSVPDQPYFTTVNAPAKIDVKLAAKLADMTEEEFTALNPEHRKPVAVASDGKLVLPLDKAETFEENLENYDKPLVSWTTYNARRGEYVDTIARRHGLTRRELLAVNDTLRLDRRLRLRYAQPVLVPIPRSPAMRHAAATLRTASAGGAASRASNAGGNTHIYVVRSGDTLYAIAHRFDTGVDTLLRLNALSPRTLLHPGRSLRVPDER
ncbi:MAG TPA: transglycosylase SLT domain-containing protein [Usitatibacter sp.]|nr:transglycosylase SLT domain-containing protein [Usitatibacter sp.]